MLTGRGATPTSVPDRPLVTVVLNADGTGSVNGRPVTIPSRADARAVLLTEACRFAATLGRPVRVTAHDPDGLWDLVAHPDGSVTASGRAPGGRRARRPVLQRRDRTGDRSRAPAYDAGDHHPDDIPDDDAADDDADDAADDESAYDVRLTAPDVGPTWYQAPHATTRPRPSAAAVGTPSRSGPGLAPDPDERRRSRPEPVVWSGRAADRRSSTTRSLVAGLVVGGLALTALIAFTVPRAPDRVERASALATVGNARSGGGRAAASVSPPGTLEAAVPPGFRRAPAWSVEIAGWTRSFATDNGTVLTRDPAGHVLLLDPATGRTVWASDETTTNDLSGPWPSTVDGGRAAVVTGAGRLTYWTLPTPTATAPAASSAAASSEAAAAVPSSAAGSGTGGAAVTVPLPAGATVSWAGPAPLVHLATRAVAVVRSGGLVVVPLPAGAVGLAADRTAVLAVTGTTWVRQPIGAAPVAPRAFPRPAGAGAAPLRVEAVGAALLLTVWPKAAGAGQVVALMDVGKGTVVVQTEVTAPADLRTFGVVREVGGTQLALGPVVVDTYAAKVDLLDLRYVVKGLSRGHAWTLFNGKQATDLHLTSTGDFTAVLFGDGDAALPVGVSRLHDGTDRPVVTAPAGSGWVLAGLAAGS